MPAPSDFVYPVAWWCLLPLIDEWNRRRAGLSFRSRGVGRFFAITAPVSVLYWLAFEVLNLPAPQWRYRGGITELWLQVVFGFVAFATVIPIVIQAWWLVTRRDFCLPVEPARRHGPAFAAAGLGFAALPFFNDVFWFNQGMWLTPALLLLPYSRPTRCGPIPRFLLHMALTGLLAGLAWEAINFTARTRWQYLILPDWPHLFEMPAPGYLGFVPFVLSTLAVYEWQNRLPMRGWLIATLYGTALAGLTILTKVYVDRGLWVFV